ncbi:4'-phosphopantetheinyl transferase [Streptomyces lunaelactis]|uniref:4'-phosphopantetheinyl transferase n=1 Tax=Streptomyces lunaelactis TaxID=1535768 RepID=A0A2R4T1U8_9ACTN|nr:4'-phosphopantetheinyl transferase superfamily protein [Streptomyces lunaelactis]AVZ73091.1 4'-phosphopantetheinyl transferase [Streptomyces lunaelactis]NUK01337.1 4'-phosphopantetheinyl transferase superfamily protein [Streptomyces lunaelactis]NUK09195.1 4'-phosphopantetheinyl transferase superfamily protein [Streptomyces lunaelactis]NUK15568.1 4'-phosphopantetheinyl transferase superfamily protein [Streptomyces lunaelactis]NUK25097.1 4'-phosphopantetheinyl transferase superfamily protein 
MLSRVLPSGVAVAESYADLPEAQLHPAERGLAVTFRAGRRAEFATVRHCARRAGRSLGLPPFPLLPGDMGAPLWPAGVVGSMTHCRGYRGAAVANAADVRALGIDAEPHLPLPDGMLERIALPEELRHQEALRSWDQTVSWDRLLFCVKEAVYKVWSPLTGHWLGFHETSVLIQRSPPVFTARLLRAAPDGCDVPSVLGGRWLAEDSLLLAAIAVRH